MAIIRQQIMDAVYSRMQSITYANGFNREVGNNRVYNANHMPQNLPTPAVVLLQGPESVDNRIGDRYQCSLVVTIGFVDTFAGRDSDAEANEFLADIQKALSSPEISYTTTNYSSGASVTTTATILEIINSLNSGDLMKGRVHGELDVAVGYVRSIFDPQKQ
jgi:hypothetical protein